MSVDVWMVLLWGCLDNVKMVSEGVWGGFNAKSVHDTQILPFFQCQEFLSLEPSTECCCENPRKLWYDDHDWKSQMFGVMAQHVFHDDEEDRTAWGVVYELTQCFYILILETPCSLFRPSRFYPIWRERIHASMCVRFWVTRPERPKGAMDEVKEAWRAAN